MGGSSSKSSADQDSSVKNATSGSALSFSAGEGANVRAFSTGDSNFNISAGKSLAIKGVTLTDFGAVMAAVDLAEMVSMQAVNAGRDIAGDAFAYAGAAGKQAFDYAGAAGTQAALATREALAAVSKSAENDASELVATMARYGAFVVVAVAVVLLVRSKKA